MELIEQMTEEQIEVWISVYDSINGPKLRTLYKRLKCSSYEAVGILNFLWMWGMNNCDRDGLCLEADKDDLILYFSGVGAGSKLPVSDIVNALIETRWIDVEGKNLYLHDWAVWQKEWYRYKDRLEKDRSRKGTIDATQDISHREPEAKAEEKPKPKRTYKRPEPIESPDGKSRYTPEFEEFWKNYPRKTDKGGAFIKFQQCISDGWEEKKLVFAAIGYAKECKKLKTEPKFVKHAATFLGRQMAFTPYIEAGEKAEKNKVDTSGNPFEVFEE